MTRKESHQPKPTHVRGTTKGEELVSKIGTEPGRNDPGKGPHRTARDSTSINPDTHGPIDPRMPEMPPA